MKRRKKFSLATMVASEMILACFSLLLLATIESESMLMMKTNCLSSSPNCVCTWKGGKFVADCSQQSLSKVPNNDYYNLLNSNAAGASGSNQMSTLNRDIQQLDLSVNNITQLESQEFSRKKFKNLQKIYLNTNQVLSVHPDAFYKLIGLIELDLSENLISNLEIFNYHYNNSTSKNHESSPSEDQDNEEDDKSTSKAPSLSTSRTGSQHNNNINNNKHDGSFLKHLGKLRILNLSSNQLKKLDKFAFSSLTQLRQLILSNNLINHVDKRAFDGLNLLNILHLDGNKLSHLDGELLFKLPQLHSLQLGGSNPWHCDCRLRKLVRLLVPKFLRDYQQARLQDPASGSPMATTQSQVSAAGTGTAAAKILQDEPQCVSGGRLSGRFGLANSQSFAGEQTDVVVSGKLASDERGDEQTPDSNGPLASTTTTTTTTTTSEQTNEAAGRGIVWTNMRLADFQCAPRLVVSLMAQSITTATATQTSGSNVNMAANLRSRRKVEDGGSSGGNDNSNSSSNSNSDNDNDNDDGINNNEKQMENQHSHLLPNQIIVSQRRSTLASSKSRSLKEIDERHLVIVERKTDDKLADKLANSSEAQAINTNLDNGKSWRRGASATSSRGDGLSGGQDVADRTSFSIANKRDSNIVTNGTRDDDKSGILLDMSNRHSSEPATAAKRQLGPSDRKLRGRNDGKEAVVLAVPVEVVAVGYNQDNAATKVKRSTGNREQNYVENEQTFTMPAQKQTIVSMEQTYLPKEPIELTCPLELTDELDLDLIQIEWWLLDSSNSSIAFGQQHTGHQRQQKHRPVLIWRSSSPSHSQPLTSTEAAALAPTTGTGSKAKSNNSISSSSSNSDRQLRLLVESLEGREFAVIDYVTRANGSLLGSASNSDGANEKNDADSSARGQQDSDETQVGGQIDTVITRVEHLIIDSASSPLITGQAVSSGSDVGGGGKSDDGQGGEKKDERHQDASSSASFSNRMEKFFLCRITNSVGQLDVLFPIVIDGSSPVARMQSRRRLAMRKQLVAPLRLDFNQALVASSSPPSSSQVPRYPFTGGGGGGSTSRGGGLERAKISLRRELDKAMNEAVNNRTQVNVTSQRELFIPIHLPEDLIKLNPQSQMRQVATSTGAAQNQFQSAAASGTNLSSQARSLDSISSDQMVNHQTRPTTRQTNSTSTKHGSTGPLITARITHAPSKPETADSDTITQARRDNLDAPKISKTSLKLLSLNLIGRYTSNKLSLVDMNYHRDEPMLSDIETSYGDPRGEQQNLNDEVQQDNRPLVDRLRFLTNRMNTQYLSGWLHSMARDAPLIIGICSGILIGCLITTLIIFRLKCNNHHRVGDLSKEQKRQVTFKKDHNKPNKQTVNRRLKIEDIECYGDDEQEDDDEYDEEYEEDNERQEELEDQERESENLKERNLKYCEGDGQPVATISGSLVGERKFVGQSQAQKQQHGRRKLTASGNSSSSTTNDSQRRLIISSDESHELHTSSSICFNSGTGGCVNGFSMAATSYNGLPGHDNTNNMCNGNEATLRRSKRMLLNGDCIGTTVAMASLPSAHERSQVNFEPLFLPADCSCPSTADEVNDGDVSGVSNLELDSILSQTCMSIQQANNLVASQHKQQHQHQITTALATGSRAPSNNGNSLLFSLPGCGGGGIGVGGDNETRYIVVAQHPADYPHQVDNSPPTYDGCSYNQQLSQVHQHQFIYGPTTTTAYEDHVTGIGSITNNIIQ